MPTTRYLDDRTSLGDSSTFMFASMPSFHPLAKEHGPAGETQHASATMLMPSPRMVRSGSKENAPTHTASRKKRPLPSPASSSSGLKPPRQTIALGNRRVVFSPTPLPSLQSSPRHKRASHDFGATGHVEARPPKRARRHGVYSNHPFLGLAARERDGSSSPEEEEEEEFNSSPPTTPEEEEGGGGGRDELETDDCAGYFKFPFTFPGLMPPKSNRKPPSSCERRTHRAQEEEEDDEETDTATDSESESNFVSSLLLHRLPSSSSSISSSSPIRSPSKSLHPTVARGRASPGSSAWLKGILKPAPPGRSRVVKALNEKEGTRRNGRGRKHVIGWDDMRPVETTDDSHVDGAEGQPAAEGQQVNDRSGAHRDDNSSRPTRTTRSSGSVSKPQQTGKDGEEDDEGKGNKRSASAGLQSTTSGRADGGDDLEKSRTTSREEPWLLRTPLLVLKASLRPVSADHVRPPGALSDFAPLLEPRASPTTTGGADMLVDTEDADDHEPAHLFETPTFLTDVESAYVDLTRAVFQLPSELSSPETTLEPLKSFRKTFVSCLARDLENIVSFPAWVKRSTATTSSPVVPSSGSSSPSSPTRGGPNTDAAADARHKKSLTEEQMRRLRDEIGVAQAALRCATAIMRDERVYRVFNTRELTSLVRLVSSLPTAPGLNNLAQRDLFPFVPFLLQDQTLPRDVLSPVLDSHILPAVESLLSLPYRADRHRIALGETLGAIAKLLTTHSREMVERGNWQVWFEPSVKALWDGPKKGISVKGRSLKVAGRLVRCLTAPIEWTRDGIEWVRERESIGRQIGETMLALLNEIPEDPVQGRRPQSSRLQLLTQQWNQMTKNKAGTNAIDEANLLFHASLLSILPALLGPSFRKIEDKGIAPWLKPYNQLWQSQTSVHLLATLSLSWNNLGYAFFRSTSAADEGEVSWILRRRGNENKALSVLSNIFKTRQEAWIKGDGGVTPTKKERKRALAKALAITYAASLHGLTVSIHHGFSSVRDLSSSNDVATVAPLTTEQMDNFDEVFDRLVVPYLPSLTRGPFVESSRIGWTALASILRPRTRADRFATLEDIVNPALLDVQLASAKTTEFLDFALATVFAKAFEPAKMTAWGSEWVQSRLDKVLALLEACVVSSPLLAEDFAGTTWTSILASVEGDDASLTKALDWLVQLDSSSNPLAPGFTRDLWAATVSRDSNAVTGRVGELAGNVGISQRIFSAWERTSAKSESVAVALARGWTASLLDMTKPLSIEQVDRVMKLLRHYINSGTLSSHSEAFENLSAALNARLWQGDTAEVEEHIRLLLRPPADIEDIFKLCTLFLSSSHNLPTKNQGEVVALGVVAIESVLRSDTVREETIFLIANMLTAASDSTYSELYEAVLESIATRRPSSDSLMKFVPLLTPSLDRALDFHAEAVVDDDGTQLETFAPRPHLQASLHPLLAFNKFWQKTYAQTSIDIVYPPELVSRLHLVRGLAQDVMETQAQDSQLYSQLEESVRTFSSAEEQARMQALKSAPPTMAVSTRDYEADVDQSRFHPPTGDVVAEDTEGDTTVFTSGGYPPSVSLHGPVAPERAVSVIQETPKEILISNSKASYASLASSEAHQDAIVTEEEQQPPGDEMTLGDYKKRFRNAKKRKLPSEPATPQVMSSPSSDEDDVVIVTSGPSSSSSKPPRKKAKVAARKKATKPAVEAKNSPVLGAESVREQRTASAPRSKRSKGKGKVAPASSPSPTSASDSAAASEAASSSLGSGKEARAARRRSQDEQAIRRVLSLPLETVAHFSNLIGGTASLHRLMAIGEAAKDYFDKLKRSPSH